MNAENDKPSNGGGAPNPQPDPGIAPNPDRTLNPSPTIRNADPGEGRTRLEPHSPTANSPFGPGNQPPGPETGLPQSLQGRYKLVRMLGKGGFASVYLAEDTVLDQQVAIKVLKLGMTSKPDQDRFLREARIGARLRHPHIAQVFDIIAAPDGLQMVMEFCPGGTLSDLIKTKGALKPLRAIQIARQAGQALAHAHQHQFIHRDIKPANIFFMKDGTVKLGDFGIAASVTSHEMTQTGMIIGTPIYMAPEQSSDSRDVDPRADIYSLGLTLYVMLTGHSPRVIDLDIVPPEFRSLIKHSTAADRNQRMVSAEQFCAMLDKIERELRTKSKATPEPSATAATLSDAEAAPAASGQTSSVAPVTSQTTGSTTAPGSMFKTLALGGAIAVIIILLSAITVMLVRQNQEIANRQRAAEERQAAMAAARANSTPAIAPGPQAAGPQARNGRPGFGERIPPRLRPPLPARTAPGPRPAASIAPTPAQTPRLQPSPTTPPAAQTPLPNLVLGDGIKNLLASSRDLEMAFQNFKTYDKLDPMTKGMIGGRSLETLQIARDTAIRNRNSESIPVLHVLVGYALFRQNRFAEARAEIGLARIANRRLWRPYNLDDRPELQAVFGLDEKDLASLFGPAQSIKP